MDHLKLFKNLQYKGQNPMLILNAPVEIEDVFRESGADIHQAPTQAQYDYIHLFASTQAEADMYSKMAVDALSPAGLLWVSYPKGTSRKLKSEVNRDNGWDVLAALNFEPVRAVSIDDDWSALRFRPVDQIKNFKRSFAKSDEGKKRLKDENNG